MLKQFYFFNFNSHFVLQHTSPFEYFVQRSRKLIYHNKTYNNIVYIFMEESRNNDYNNTF